MESGHPLTLAEALRAAERTLRDAGVPSPRADAEEIAAHLMRCGRGEVLAASLRGTPAPHGFEAMVAERATRVPLQHLTGRAAFRHVELDVGPGVFVPRPETELVAGAAIDAALKVPLGERAEGRSPVVVDLCTGSGAIAAAVADEVAGAQVHACELDPMAHAWASRNLERSGVDLRMSDAADAFPDLDGTVDVVVSNPPYIPPGCEPQDPEVREHDPEVALYGGGEDGLAVPRTVVVTAARLLRAGGVLVMEHADTQQQTLLAWLGNGPWRDVEGHRDLADRPRFVTAVRVGDFET
ncbi:MAG TPA: peptide chain release factor N(5)-glutamine methyltransferase [Actinomycetales bacterium]|nr:peptide chain release factor N(5)-glutamine methyltransferase [Actinomycetales bacterium]